MKIFNKAFLSDFTFASIMAVTRIFPEITPVLRLRGRLSKFIFKKCGNNLQISKDVRINGTSNLEFGDDVFLSGGSWIMASELVTLGDGVMLGPYSVLITGNHTKESGSYRFGKPDRSPIRIGKGSWIGSHSTVTKGIKIGSGCLLAANSVATKNIPDDSIAGGVPAKVIKTD